MTAETLDSEWEVELRRGEEGKRELLADAGCVLSADEVSQRLGIDVAEVERLRAERRLLAVPLDDNTWGFPACQLTSSEAPNGLARVLAAFDTDSPWVHLSILLSREPSLGADRLIDLVLEGRHVDEVERIARSYGSQGPT